jgi:hypothetical protein
MTPILPLVDLGSNIGAAGLLPAALRKHSFIAEYYRVNPVPTPYWTAYSLMAVTTFLFGPFAGAKLIVALDVLLLPAAAVRLAHALGRNPRIGLLAFLLCWDVNLYWGWVSFSLGMPLALFALARLAEVRTFSDARRLFPLALLVAFTHIHAVTLLGVAGVLMGFARRPLFQGLRLQATALLGTTVVLLPWIGQRFFGHSGAAKTALTFGYPAVIDKVTNLFAASVSILPLREGPAVDVAVFATFVGLPAMLGALPQTSVSARRLWSGLAFVAGAALLYFALPFRVSGPLTHWWTYPRYATYVLLGLALAPRPRLDGMRAWVLVFPLALALVQHRAIRAQFSHFSTRVTPFLAIIDAMEPNRKMLTLDYTTSDAEVVYGPLGQMHGYAAAAKNLYDGHLFDEPNNPLLFRPEKRIPHPGGVAWWPLNDFSMETQGKLYDYIVVRGLSSDPLRSFTATPAVSVRLLKESGDWRVYAVAHTP